MQIQIEPTPDIVDFDGAPARVWLGTTDQGIEVKLFIRAVMVRADKDCSQFQEALKEIPPPRELQGRTLTFRDIL
jgi:hypothetical protein